MRLHQEKINVETSEPIKSQSFGIREQDMSMVIDVLSSKMYADPILAFVRETACNARDSHREAGFGDKAIEITLPSLFSKQVEIKDTGTGINVRRFDEIFLNYCASTKRNSNVFLGSFGLGAKSWRSVSSTCSIITIHNGTKRHYTAFIDESKLGQCDLQQEYPTDEHNGTTIIVPIKEADIAAYARAVINSTKHWNTKHNSGVRPIIHNLPEGISYPEDKKIMLEGEDWELFHPASSKDYYGANKDKFLAIIDGIAYDVTYTDLDLIYGDNEKLQAAHVLLNKNINVYFPIGKLSLASNRDNIHFDDRTKKIILDKLVSIGEQIVKMGSEQVTKEPSLDKAEIFWHKFKDYISFASKTTPIWNGYELSGIYRRADNNVTINSYNYKIHYNNNADGFHRSDCDRILFHENNEIFINDEEKSFAIRKRLQSYIDENKATTKFVYVLKFGDDASRAYWMDNLGLKHVDLRLISSLPEYVMERKPREIKDKVTNPRANKTEINAWYYSPSYSGKNLWVSEIISKEKETGIYIECTNKKTNEFNCTKINVTNYSLGAIKKFLEVDKIYTIRTQDIKYLGSDWKRLEDVVIPKAQEVLDKYSQADIDKVVSQTSSCIDKIFPAMANLKLEDKILSVDSPFKEYLKESRIITNLQTEINKTSIIRNIFRDWISDAPKAISVISNLSKMVHKIEKRYPLLSQMGTYCHPKAEAVSEYINLIDAKYNAEQQLSQVG